MQPLYSALVGKPKELQWNEAMISAFHRTTEALFNATMLAHPHTDAMHPKWQWVQHLSSLFMAHGSHLPSSAGSSDLLRESIVPLTVSFLLFT
jgi:hypothetical protein